MRQVEFFFSPGDADIEKTTLCLEILHVANLGDKLLKQHIDAGILGALAQTRDQVRKVSKGLAGSWSERSLQILAGGDFRQRYATLPRAPGQSVDSRVSDSPL